MKTHIPHTATPWLDCGHGSLIHPVTGATITTDVIEAQGFGRIGEWYDYSNEPAGNFLLILRAVNNHRALVEALKECITDTGALGYSQPNKYARVRLATISQTAKSALANL